MHRQWKRGPFAQAVRRANAFLLTALKALGVLLMLSILLLMFLQVIARFVFSSPYPWAEEVARYSYVWMVFIASVFVAGERSHIAVHLFEKQLAPKARTLVNAAAMVIVAVACCVLAAGSFEWLTGVSAGASAALGIPSDLLYGVVWGSLIGIGIYSLLNALLTVFGIDKAKESSLVDEVLEEGAGG